MIKLNSLKNLIGLLTKDEFDSLINFLHINVGHGNGNLKSVQLVEILRDNLNYTALEIQNTLYSEKNTVAFNKLVNRVYNKVLEVITFDSNLVKGNYSARNKAVFESRKKLFQIELIILKGIRENLDRDLDIIINKCNDYEIYDVLVQALYTKQRFLLLQLNERKGKNLHSEILQAERCWIAFNSSQALFNKISSKLNATNESSHLNIELDEAVNKLKVNFDDTSSPTILYYYLLLVTELAQRKYEYVKATSYLEALLRNLNLNKSVYTDYRYGITLINIANNFLHTHEFDKAQIRINESFRFFKNQPVNLAIANEINFLIQFYTENYEDSLQTIDQLILSSKSLNVPLLVSKWSYYKGCNVFLTGDFSMALRLFDHSSEIEQDKEGWNFMKRIMILLCKIELNDFDSADLKLQSLDRFMKRLMKANYVKPRLIIIVRVLRKLANEGFDYTKVYTARKKYFEMLESNDIDYSWKVKSPEMIIFHEWFKSHLNNEKYSSNIQQHILN
ncbi:MAG: hypothetical protein U0073_13745 [Bacteroidia bacterium]